MIDSLELVAAVAFQTNRGGVAGQATLGDVPSAATRAYRCLVSGSLQTGAAVAIAAGRYSCTLGGGNDDIAVSDLQLMASSSDEAAGGAANGSWVKVTRTAASIFEVDVYTVAANVPALADTVGGLVQNVKVSWYRLALA